MSIPQVEAGIVLGLVVMKDCLESRVAALDYLRAVACLLVVVGHICLLGCSDPASVKTWVPSVTTALYPLHANPYGTGLVVLAQRTGLNVGHLGVALFFLLSGFVILRALDRESAGPFALKRLFRILPCNAAAVLVTLAAVAAACRLDGVANPLTLGDGLASTAIAMNYAERLPVMPVLWTLEVEVAFYAAMALLAASAPRIGSGRLIVASLACSNLVFLLLGLARTPALAEEIRRPLAHTAQILLYLPLLLTGAVAYRRWSEGWRRGSALCVGAALALFCATDLAYGAIAGRDGLGVDATGVALALALFAAALAWPRGRRWLAPLRCIGAISYPLYLVHAPLGWIVLAGLARLGFGVHTACLGALLAAGVAATALHVLVERPAQRFGAGLAARLPLGPFPAAAPAVTAA